MRRERFLEFALAGSIVYGVQYVVLVFVASLHTSCKPAMLLSLVTAGLGYLNCGAHWEGWLLTANLLNVLAIATGALAGITLLWVSLT